MTEKHDCSIPVKMNGPMVAIDMCYQDDSGRLHVTNGEYGNQVLFCPFCGKEAVNKEPQK